MAAELVIFDIAGATLKDDHAGFAYVIGFTTGIFSREDQLHYHPAHIVDHMQDILSLVRA